MNNDNDKLIELLLRYIGINKAISIIPRNQAGIDGILYVGGVMQDISIILPCLTAVHLNIL